MECQETDYRKILGLRDKYESPNEERQAVFDAFKNLGRLTHWEYNKHEHAKEAFNSK